MAALVEHGLDELTAQSVLGDWAAVRADFVGNTDGLATSVIAGLAERTLARRERDDALSQVAYSPRCLARLASTCNLLAAVRAILPELPPGEMGARFVSSVASISFGRADLLQ